MSTVIDVYSQQPASPYRSSMLLQDALLTPHTGKNPCTSIMILDALSALIIITAMPPTPSVNSIIMWDLVSSLTINTTSTLTPSSVHHCSLRCLTSYILPAGDNQNKSSHCSNPDLISVYRPLHQLQSQAQGTGVINSMTSGGEDSRIPLLHLLDPFGGPCGYELEFLN